MPYFDGIQVDPENRTVFIESKDDMDSWAHLMLSGDVIQPFIDYMIEKNVTFNRCSDGMCRLNRSIRGIHDHIRPESCCHYTVTFPFPEGQGLDDRKRLTMREVSDLVTEIEYIICGHCLVKYGPDLGYSVSLGFSE